MAQKQMNNIVILDQTHNNTKDRDTDKRLEEDLRDDLEESFK